MSRIKRFIESVCYDYWSGMPIDDIAAKHGIDEAYIIYVILEYRMDYR